MVFKPGKKCGWGAAEGGKPVLLWPACGARQERVAGVRPPVTLILGPAPTSILPGPHLTLHGTQRRRKRDQGSELLRGQLTKSKSFGVGAKQRAIISHCALPEQTREFLAPVRAPGDSSRWVRTGPCDPPLQV